MEFKTYQFEAKFIDVEGGVYTLVVPITVQAPVMNRQECWLWFRLRTL